MLLENKTKESIRKFNDISRMEQYISTYRQLITSLYTCKQFFESETEHKILNVKIEKALKLYFKDEDIVFVVFCGDTVQVQTHKKFYPHIDPHNHKDTLNQLSWNFKKFSICLYEPEFKRINATKTVINIIHSIKELEGNIEEYKYWIDYYDIHTDAEKKLRNNIEIYENSFPKFLRPHKIEIKDNFGSW